METTLNVRNDILEKINQAAQLRGISRSEMIIMLIKNVMKDVQNSVRFGIRVRYQKRSNPHSSETVHVLVGMDDYEYLQDLRRLLKMSISLILAKAVKKFLKEIMKKNDTDNYFKNYILIKEIFNDVICWKLVWGFPPGVEQILR